MLYRTSVIQSVPESAALRRSLSGTCGADRRRKQGKERGKSSSVFDLLTSFTFTDLVTLISFPPIRSSYRCDDGSSDYYDRHTDSYSRLSVAKIFRQSPSPNNLKIRPGWFQIKAETGLTGQTSGHEDGMQRNISEHKRTTRRTSQQKNQKLSSLLIKYYCHPLMEFQWSEVY